jgi:ABC-2 type transport system permease protein
MSVISSTTLARDAGILKRIRSTPLRPWIYMTGRVVSAGLVALVGAVVVLAVGAGVYDFEIVWSAVPAALVTVAVAMFCFCSLGFAVTVLVPTADSALPIAWGTILPLSFVSDVFQPIDTAPHWLRDAASWFPLRPFADALESLFNPITGSRALPVGHLVVMVAWGLAAAAFALVAFRWEPAGSRARGRRQPGSGAFAPERLRGLLSARGTPAPRARRAQGRAVAPPPAAGGNRRASALAGTELIEGPAPAEDSSIPADGGHPSARRNGSRLEQAPPRLAPHSRQDDRALDRPQRPDPRARGPDRGRR